ncbi:MAG: CBS domain-containing protein, partial [Thermosynechococcaceae cyanobacterium]
MQLAPTFSLEQALDRTPLTLAPETPLAEVIRLMSQVFVHCHLPSEEADAAAQPSEIEPHTSCVLVVNPLQLVGILTERDLVRLIAEHRSLDGLTVAQVMSQQVITLQAEENLDVFSALDFMRRHQIRHLPVVNEQGQVLGLLTPKRLRRLLEPGDFMKFRQVHEAMNTSVIHTAPTDSVLQAVQTMTQHRVSCVVIVQPADDKAQPLRPIGIMTERDIVQFHRLELNLERTQAQEVMSTPLFLVRPEDSLWTVHQMMQRHKVLRLVVTDAEGDLQGIVTQSNLLPVDPAEMYEVVNLLQHQVSALEHQNRALLQRRNDDLEQIVQERTVRLQRREQMLRNLALGVATEQGEDFLRSLTLHLAAALQVDHVHIGTLRGGSIQTLAVYGNGQIQPNFEYSLVGTPCEAVVTQQSCIHCSNVQDLFPHDPMLRDKQIEAYFGTPLHNATGQVVGILVALSRQIQQDPDFMEEVLTIFAARASAELERQQAKATQQASQQRLNSILDSLEDVIWSVTADSFELLYLSPAAEHIYGRPSADFYANPDLWLQIIHPEDQHQVKAWNEVLLETGHNECEYRIVRPDDSIRWILGRAKVIYDADGGAVRIDGIASDITNRKQAEDQIQEQATLLDIAADAIIVRDLDGTLTFWNYGAAMMYGWR